MLTLPKLVDRPAQPYVAIRRTVKIPFNEAAEATVKKLFKWVKDSRIEPAGPLMFKYNLIDMGAEMEMEFGVPTSTLYEPDMTVITGTLPAGRYATATFHGHYDKLRDATAMIMGWAKERRIRWDSHTSARGEHFAARFEVYPNDPSEVPDPNDWETEIWIKVKQD